MTTSVSVDIYFEHCYSCGTPFGMSAALQRRFRNKHETFYCPSGHGQVYAQPVEQKLREAEAALRIEQESTAYLRSHNDQLLTDLNKKSKEIAQIKRRANAGVCPHCHRTFQQVSRHMASKHPEEATG